jgi:hypothetical protein
MGEYYVPASAIPSTWQGKKSPFNPYNPVSIAINNAL